QLKLWFRSPECPPKIWEMDARKGGRYRYSQAGTTAVNGVKEFECHGEITGFDPPRLLAYTWLANWHDDPPRRTMVRWELAASKGKTKVKVTHSGLADLPIARKDYSGGWTGVVGMLKEFVER